ncbi:MAG: hypothetical protein JRI55_02200, partial [Deltaproteobacteria bacterium]|nr:hypothetical protein [Deltaproteobacteria bacterium]
MRIRTRLFLGTTALVLALVLVQWWLQNRQVEAIRGELARVAATVGESLVLGQGVHATGEPHSVRAELTATNDVFVKRARPVDVLQGPDSELPVGEAVARERRKELV